jgi:Tol biopolymer transport system component
MTLVPAAMRGPVGVTVPVAAHTVTRTPKAWRVANVDPVLLGRSHTGWKEPAEMGEPRRVSSSIDVRFTRVAVGGSKTRRDSATCGPRPESSIGNYWRSTMKQITVLAIAAVLIAGDAGIATAEPCLLEAIAFTSTRDNPTGNPFLTAEIYLMDPDGTNPRRLTENSDGDATPALSPDGKRIVFDSNRNRAVGEPLNISDLFLMQVDGTAQTLLTRGSSATWSPNSKFIAYHRSASGTGLPIRPDPGAPALDSDIFVARVGALLDNEAPPVNVTNTEGEIEEDADWSSDGQKIVYTRHPASDQPPPPGFHYTTKEIWVMNADGTGQTRLTFNTTEERGPAWSPNGTRIAYMCRLGDPVVTPTGVVPTFEICVMNADGSEPTRLTFNAVGDFSPRWSPDGLKIVFSRAGGGTQQTWVMDADGTGQMPLTIPPGFNSGPDWGEIKTNCAEGQ